MEDEFRVSITPTGWSYPAVEVDVTIRQAQPQPTITGVRIIPSSGQFVTLPTELGALDFLTCVTIARGLVTAESSMPAALAEPERSPSRAKASSESTARTPTAAAPKSVVKKTGVGGASVRGVGAPSDIATVYWRLGSAVKIAKHYDVPNQVARDWIRELRGGSSWKR